MAPEQARGAARRRRARRRLLARLRALRVPHRAPPFAASDADGGARQDPARGAAARRASCGRERAARRSTSWSRACSPRTPAQRPPTAAAVVGASSRRSARSTRRRARPTARRSRDGADARRAAPAVRGAGARRRRARARARLARRRGPSATAVATSAAAGATARCVVDGSSRRHGRRRPIRRRGRRAARWRCARSRRRADGARHRARRGRRAAAVRRGDRSRGALLRGRHRGDPTADGVDGAAPARRADAGSPSGAHRRGDRRPARRALRGRRRRRDGLELRGERDVADAARTLLGKPTPCVGRERELATLDGALRRVRRASARRARCWSPRAAGVGQVAPALRAPAPARRARGEPCRDLDRPRRSDARRLAVRHARAARSAAPPASTTASRSQVRRQQAARARRAPRRRADDAARVAEFLGELVGAPLPDDAATCSSAPRASDAILMGDQMRRAFEDLLAAECAAQPLLLVLEDLHWGDLPTVQLRRRGAAPPARAAADGARAGAARGARALPAAVGRARRAASIRLAELSRKRASERLVREVLGDDVAPRRWRAIVERAGGNAFYLEELIRAVGRGQGRRAARDGAGDGAGAPRARSSPRRGACCARRACSARSSGAAACTRCSASAATTRDVDALARRARASAR